ncbi:MAG: serine hydrolase [Permianibacter sp.]
MKPFAIAAAALLLLPSLGLASSTPDPKAIDALVTRHAELNLFTGTVLVAKAGKTVYSGAYGDANRDYGIPNRLNTRYNIGSIGKTFTATAIMQLVQAGKLKLGDPIGKYLPDFPHAEKASITVQHLLNHSSGLGDYMGHPDYPAKMASITAIADILPLIYSEKPLFNAGERFEYSNSAMVLAGAIIEKVSGLSYPEYLQRHILAPAGLTETVLAQEHDVLPNRSIGYSPTAGGGLQANVRTVMPASSDGGLRTTVSDLLRFDQALYGDKLLNAASRQQMFTPVGPVPFMASGWFVAEVDGHRMVGHGGGAPGVSAEFRRYLDDGYTLIVLSNYDLGAAPLTEAIERLLFGLPYRLPTRVEADYALAQHFMHAGKAAAALALFDQLVAGAKPHVPSLYMSARLRILGKTELEQAIAALERYIALAGAGASPPVSAAWWRKGNAHELLGKLTEARQCYEQALKLNPEDEEAKRSLAALGNAT